MINYKEACKEIILKLYEEYTSQSNLFTVYNIFIEHFGEDFVDLQGYLSLQKFKEFLSNCRGDDFELKSEYSHKILKDLSAAECYYTLEDLFKGPKSNKIIDFVNDFIDIHGIPEIIIYYPKVTVTNEYNRSINITDLYVKIKVNHNGSLFNSSISMTRGSYTIGQLFNDYLHSHAPAIPQANDWVHCCLGTGPINSTIASLIREFDSDIWYLFVFELSKYVTVESIEGAPYRYLEKVPEDLTNESNYTLRELDNTIRYNLTSSAPLTIRHIIDDFIQDFIQHNNIKYTFNENKFNLGMTDLDFTIYISNKFISWYNNAYNLGIFNTPYTLFKRENYLFECKIINNKICRIERDNIDVQSLIERFSDRPICKFKNQDIKLKIISPINTNNVVTNNTILLSKNIVSYIATKLLYIINYKYGTINNNTTRKKTKFF